MVIINNLEYTEKILRELGGLAAELRTMVNHIESILKTTTLLVDTLKKERGP